MIGADGAAAYDALAGRYDALPRDNPVLAHLRAESLAALRRHLPTRGRLLEIGCGTGEEAVALLRERAALRVRAYEPAAGMRRVATARAREAGVAERLDVVDGRARDVAREPAAAYDGAWASFSLSYEPDLARAARALAHALAPRAPAVVTVRNVLCAAEWWSVPARALDLYRHKVGDARIGLRHATAAGAARAFARAGLRVRARRAMPLVLPPPRYAPLLRPLRRALPALRAADRRLAGLPALRAMGDHTLLVLERAA